MKFYPEGKNPQLSKQFETVDDIKDAMVRGKYWNQGSCSATGSTICTWIWERSGELFPVWRALSE